MDDISEAIAQTQALDMLNVDQHWASINLDRRLSADVD